jgi:glycosyltransferase involved in cell wall biosynthesis
MTDRSQADARQPCIGILSLSMVPDDPRVRRQGDLFHGHGWKVGAFGLPGARSEPPDWSLVELEAQDADAGSAGRNRSRARKLFSLLRVFLRKAHATSAYWEMSRRHGALLELARGFRPDIWLANDWTALPIARRLAAEQGVPFAYDTHELAVDEYAERLVWRLARRPVIAAVERAGIAGSAVTSCVSQGIADRLHQLYGLREKPLLIRNMPQYEAHPHRPTGERIEVLYHGVVNVGRGLEACIDSVARWRPEFHLTIRGPGPADYLAALASRIESAGLGGRVVLAPPVPMIDLVREAARFDIGLFALPGHSQQNVHVLPNKFFEYTMAGLALCVSDLPEMTALLRQHDLGRLIPDVTPEAIATAINGFERAEIDACKRSALEAAKLLNWEAESDRLFRAIEQAVVSQPAKRGASQS